MKQWQKGFTVVEMLVVLGITGLIAGPLTWATINLLVNPQRTADHGAALQQVQNVGYWISRDVQMTKTVSPSGGNGFPLTLTIPQGSDPDDDYSIDYVFDGDKIKRKLYDSEHVLVSETLIAQYVDTDTTTFEPIGGGSYKLAIRVVRGDAAVVTEYEVSQRLIAG